MTRTLDRRPIFINGVELPARVHTLDGFRAWIASLPATSPRLRPTVTRGSVFIETGPQDYETHSPLTTEVNRVLATLARRDRRGKYFMDNNWFTHRRAGVSTEPDGFFVLFDSFEKRRARINPASPIELLGTPDMVFEAVSKTSRKKDLEDLVEDYARAGIREYWIADGTGDEAELRILVLEGRAYREQPRKRSGWIRSPIWKRSFRLRRFVDRVGLSDFSLDVKR
jgi:Uma2 family endonuclease